MHFEAHLLGIKRFVTHIRLFVRHKLFCDYFMNHKQSEIHCKKVTGDRV